MRSLPRLLLIAVPYCVPAWALFAYIEPTLPVTMTRLLATVALGSGGRSS